MRQPKLTRNTTAYCVRLVLIGVTVVVGGWIGVEYPAVAAPREIGPGTKLYEDQFRPFLDRHCQECHSGEKPKGDWRVDELTLDFGGKSGRERWQRVREKLESGEMPPKAKARPPEQEVHALSKWIARRVAAADAERRVTQGRVVLRRFNRIEYENTVRDLLGVDTNLKDMLPFDTSADGFDNVGDALHTSSFLMDAPADKPTVIEFVDRMAPRTSISILPYGLPSSQAVHKVGADTYNGPGLAVDWVEVEGPLNDTWPPESHRRIFGDLAQAPSPIFNRSDRVEVVSNDPSADADRILRKFVRRAFRRSVTDAEVKPFTALVEAKLAEKRSFEQAIRVGLGAVMASPEFLFFREEPGPLDGFALASRLSYFLWSTMPDEELLVLAEQRELDQPDTLRAQVERMLKHPKAFAFSENFVGQWLGLRDIDFTEPSHILYPDFDDMLKVSMVRETELFFAEVLKNDLSLTNFIASDFTILNGRLAKHYGIPGVEGWEFRKMPLPPDSHRGGFLTMASVLKVTANGTATSPVTRGAWVMDRILGTPPPRPPENVAALDPDTRGATTIRQQLAKHRQIESCAACHVKIDPPGFALESFDVIGGWRDYYRSTGNGKPVIVNGRRMLYLQGPKVDPVDALPDGRPFRNIDEFKQLLLADKDQIVRALTIKLVTYATGGAPESIDRPQIEAIAGKVREANYEFRSLIHEIIQSELFRKK